MLDELTRAIELSRFTGAPKLCKRCLVTKPLTEENFRLCDELRNGRSYVFVKQVCRACEYAARVQFRRDHRERENASRRLSHTYETRQRAWLKRKYSITLEDYNSLFDAQGGVCAICHEPEFRRHQSGRLQTLAVDHDHETHTVRGLLCSNCNVAIGYLNDDPELIRAAAAYLEARGVG